MSKHWEGLLLLDKPAGPTSHDLVDRVRRAVGIRRVGHTGTLDPGATGLLALVLGRATRLARFLPDAPKLYEGTFLLGVTTTSDDLAGRMLARHDGELPGAEAVAQAAAALTGRFFQSPPAVSARKVGGKRLYALARRGASVEAPPAPVLVARFETAPQAARARYAFVAEVSSGTYVRSLVRDLGRALGCGAAVATLRRTAIGPMTTDRALPVSPDAPIDPQDVSRRLIPLDAMPFSLPSVVAAAEGAPARFLSGRTLDPDPAACPPDGPVIVRSPSGSVLGVGELSGGIVRPWVVLVPD